MENIIKAQILTEGGDVINLELYPDCAPESVANFVSLAKDGFYDGLIFHRNIPGFMIQGGGFHDGLKAKNAPHTIKGEFKGNGVRNDLGHAAGVISMARTNVPDSASSQFFICVADSAFLDGQYAAFGKCADQASIDTAVKLSKVPTRSVGYYDDVPVESVIIKTIKII